MRFILLAYLLISYAQAMPKLDPNKFTICAATINSDNERKVFEQQIKKYPEKFNPMVELLDFGEQDWLQKACDSGIQCDQLLISAHFAGSFFSEKNPELKYPIEDFEKRGCSETCKGILSHPYEVFLFGCNTLADKSLDARGPDEFRRVLIQDGFSPAVADRVVESRYGEVGDQFRSKMQRAFGGEKKKLYGFTSKGPSGSTIERMLKGYFKEQPLLSRLEKLEAGRLMNKTEKTNEALAQALKITHYAECDSGGDESNDKSRIICGMLDHRKTLDQKLTLMREALSDENYLIYVPSIAQFLADHPVEKMTPAQQGAIHEIANNKKIRDQMLTMLDKTKSLNLFTEYLSFTTSIGLIDKKTGQDKLSQKVYEAFKNNITQGDKDIICSMKGKVDLKLADIKFKAEENYLFALSCMKPSDPAIHIKFAESLSHPDVMVRGRAAVGVMKSESKDPYVQSQMAKALKDNSDQVRAQAMTYFGKIKVENPTAITNLLSILNGKNELESNTAAVILSEIEPKSVAVQLKLAPYIERNPQIRDYFQKIKPSDSRVLEEIKKRDPELWQKLRK